MEYQAVQVRSDLIRSGAPSFAKIRPVFCSIAGLFMSQEHSPTLNPCQQCGACCASFRVSFYWADAPELPPTLTEHLTPHLSCMAGTNQAKPLCLALHGVVGQSVSCSVYTARPSACREVEAGDDKCQRARRAHGLPELPGAPL